MELHPILEEDVTPNPSLWYVASAFGDRPSLRVGHTAIPVSKEGQDEANTTHQVVFIGGANPSELFSDIHVLDLETMSWNMLTPPNFTTRYEHVAFTPASRSNTVYVLAGANQESNISADYVQCYNVKTEQWSTVKTTGTAPCPRTHHSSAFVGDCVYLFSGGKVGAEPVQDRQVYCFNAATDAWSSLAIAGDSPSPRHGHTMNVVGKKVYCFGGMAGTKFYNDLHMLDLEKGMWVTPKVKKRSMPEARTSHVAVSSGSDIYVFGGLNKEGAALDDLWKLDTSTMQWSLCPNEGAPPAPRLDMASCVVTWGTKCKPSGTASSEETEEVQELAISLERAELSTPEEGAAKGAIESSQTSKLCKLLLIHGGMDTLGEIFDDCLVYRLE